MRLLADENFPKLIVEALRARGHDVLWARTDLAGMSDIALLDLAEANGRIVTDARQGLLADCGSAPGTAGRIRGRSVPGPSCHARKSRAACAGVLRGQRHLDWAHQYRRARRNSDGCGAKEVSSPGISGLSRLRQDKRPQRPGFACGLRN